MIQTNPAQLAAGVAAPLFSAEDIFGSVIDLQRYQGHPVLLSFFRNAACALCNLQVHQLIEKYPQYHGQGLDIIAVFEAPRENLLLYVGKQDAPFPIIGDPTASLYDLYGVETSAEKANASMQSPLTQGRVQAAAAIGYALTPEEGSNFFRMPADFLIDSQGIIRLAFYSQVIGEHLPFEVIEAFLAEQVQA
jgi:peroxiredoxin